MQDDARVETPSAVAQRAPDGAASPDGQTAPVHP